MQIDISLRNGSPFDVGYSVPKAFQQLLWLGRMEFRRGHSSGLNKNVDIAEGDAHKLLVEALAFIKTTLDGIEIVDQGCDDSVEGYRDYALTQSDVDSCGMGALLIQHCSDLEDSDDVLLFHASNGLWLDKKQLFSAVHLLQIDRLISAIHTGDAFGSAACVLDIHEIVLCIEQIDSIDLHRFMERLPELKAVENGRAGAAVKHRKTRELKAWALEQAEVVRGQDIDIARKLALDLPSHLIDACKNPERVIYETLLARHRRRSKGGPDRV